MGRSAEAYGRIDERGHRGRGEKNGFNCVWFAHQAETAWGAQAEGPWLTPTGPRPEGPDSGHFRSAPRTCCKSAVGWGCGKSPIGL
jgi:hypothetical protein